MDKDSVFRVNNFFHSKMILRMINHVSEILRMEFDLERVERLIEKIAAPEFKIQQHPQFI